MVRSQEAELRHRRMLREKYFEDPKYRRLSDIIPYGLNGRQYASWRDDCLFNYYLTNQINRLSDVTELEGHLHNGHQLPINWSNFYSYFDAVLNDPESRYVSELTNSTIPMKNLALPGITTKTLLNRYRNHLTNPYDMI